MNTESTVSTRVNALRVTVGALIMGILSFAGITIMMQQLGMFLGVGIPYVTYAGLALLVVMLLLRPVVLTGVDRSGRRRIDPGSPENSPWLELLASHTIIGCALLESAAFLCLTGALLDGQSWGIGGGLAAAIAMFALHFPTEEKATRFINQQRELALQERMNG